MPSARMTNLWSSADAYELYMGRWSRLVALRFVEWLDLPPGKTWLDVGCGTGALTQTILSHNPGRVVGIDPSEAFVGQALATVNDTRASFRRGDASDLLALGKFDAVVSGLVLNFLPDPAAATAEMARAI